MKNKEITITQVQLDTLSDVDTDITMTIDNVEYLPVQMIIDNQCGIDIDFILFDDDDELADSAVTPANYGYIRVRNGTAISNESLPKSRKVRVKGVTGSSTADLIIRFIEYVKR